MWRTAHHEHLVVKNDKSSYQVATTFSEINEILQNRSKKFPMAKVIQLKFGAEPTSMRHTEQTPQSSNTCLYKKFI